MDFSMAPCFFVIAGFVNKQVETIEIEIAIEIAIEIGIKIGIKKRHFDTRSMRSTTF